MNELLTKSLFSVIAFQETWFDETVDDYELIKNTNFNLIRQDRGSTTHHKKGGGGIALLIKSDLKYKQHFFNDITILQYNCITIMAEASIILLVNVYSPFGLTYQANLDMESLLQ